ncbi:MAG: septum formation initiator family protein [Planctomycetes bacterium]|nr:septum formation initiator family protein [Planctomycetota bacterium]
MDKGVKESDSLISFGWCIIISLCIVAAASIVIFRRGHERKKLLTEMLSLQTEIELLKKRNTEMRKERTSLQSDPIAVEREAREIFGVSRPGETTYDKIALPVQPAAVPQTRILDRLLPKPHPRLFDGDHWRTHVLIVIVILMAMIALTSTRPDDEESPRATPPKP